MPPIEFTPITDLRAKQVSADPSYERKFRVLMEKRPPINCRCTFFAPPEWTMRIIIAEQIMRADGSRVLRGWVEGGRRRYGEKRKRITIRIDVDFFPVRPHTVLDCQR